MKKRHIPSALHRTVSTQTFTAWQTLLSMGILVLAGFLVYADSYHGEFVYDDVQSIPDNPHIRRFWPLWVAVTGPRDSTVAGRPIVSLTLAICYRICGLHVWCYHVFNLSIHILASLLLFGIVRRTLISERLSKRFEGSQNGLALAASLLWTVHPLQTESVTYIIQRAESLMGLLYLLTLYLGIRGFGSPNRRWWFAAAVVSCALGMSCKEVMVTAPLLVLLYDRTFLSGSFKVALRRSPSLYVGLATTWVVLAALDSKGPRSKSVGFGFEHVTPLDYARTQFDVIMQYLRLSFWPRSLCFHYAWPVAKTFNAVWPSAVFVSLLVATTGWMIFRLPALGFVGAWVFVILAPTSSILPIVSEVAAEHRMYLPLAGLTVLVVLLGHMLVEQVLHQVVSSDSVRQKVGPSVCAGLVFAMSALLGYQTFQRNLDYRDAISLWGDTVRKRPDSIDAHMNLGGALYVKGRLDEAMIHFYEALRVNPNYQEAHNNLGSVLRAKGKLDEAIAHYSEALRLNPEDPRAQQNMAIALAAKGELGTAIQYYTRALSIRPDNESAHHELGLLLVERGKVAEAMSHYLEALRLQPDYADAHNSVGALLVHQRRWEEAIVHYQEALRINPRHAGAHNNFGVALAIQGKKDEAMTQYRAAIAIMPDYAEAHSNLGSLLAGQGKIDEAIGHFRQSLQLKPNYLSAQNNLARAFYLKGDYAGAWNEVDLCRKGGGQPDPILLRDLSQKMPQPK